MSRVVWLEISLFRRGLRLQVYLWVGALDPSWRCFYAALGMKCTYKKSCYGHSSEVGPVNLILRKIHIRMQRLIHLLQYPLPEVY